MSARRAARRIVRSIESGERELTLGWPAKLAVLAQALAPETIGGVMALVDRALPAPCEDGGAQRRSGWESRSRWAPSRWTRSSDRAAEIYDELEGHSAEELES